MSPVPRRSALIGPHVVVDIILKADQPTGKLTRGVIADILTKGDHPRGVKVRLQSGAIGRVQSLASTATTVRGAEGSSSSAHIGNKSNNELTSNTSAPGPTRTYRFQEDFRKNEPLPPSENASLADYIKAPSRNKKKKGRAATASTAELAASQPAMISQDAVGELQSEQTRLEQEFPLLDTALIAAILGDGGSVDAARSVLASLS